MKKRGRKGVYETHILPRFDEITKWAETGATEREISDKLGVSYSVFNKYKAEYEEFREILKKGRVKPVEEIKAALFKRATGFQFEETKVVSQRIEYDDGTEILPAKVVRTEVTTKTALPDVAAGLVLLKHWDKDSGWTADPQQLELKKKELALKEKLAEDSAW